MTPHKCSYFRCGNTSDAKSMFRFPWKDANRLQEWINNCGNITIAHLPPERLRSKYLCVDHFDSKYVRNQNQIGVRKTLRRTAIPFSYQTTDTAERSPQQSPEPSDLKVLTPKRVYKNMKKTLEIPEDRVDATNNRLDATDDKLLLNTPKSRKRRYEDDDDQLTPNCKKMKTELVKSNKKLQQEIRKNKVLKEKEKKRKRALNLGEFKFSSKSSKLLASMQFRSKKSKKQWNNEERKFCMSLYYKSPAAYKFMINSGIILAAPSTIQRWLQETNCLPGINDEVFENIKMKFADKEIRERLCTVCFDEMSIMTDLEYTSKYDLIEGFEDFGGGDRNQNEARYALVFVARGIFVDWKIPLAYFLSSKTVDSNKLEAIIRNVIDKLFECNLLPKSIVCDQATTNVKAIKQLGACVNYPFFFINNHKVFAIFDAPHLIKNIRNNLINGDFELNGNQISFNDIINVYNLDKKNKSKSLKKLTPVHINPSNFQKMKVKLATQVLSNSVAGAIKTAFDSGELQSSTAEHTADFVKLCNDLFDCLNSKNKCDPNPYRCAITKNLNSLVNQTLIKSKDAFSELKKISFNKNNEIRFSRPPCFDGMVQTINAVLQLSAEEFSAGTGVKFINTYRLNQDVIENLFGIYRIKGGCNKNPTAKSLRSMFRSNLLNNLMKFDNTNCESDQGEFVATHQNTQQTESEPQPSTSSAVQIDVDGNSPRHNENEPGPSSSITSTLDESNDSSKVDVTLETCSVVYFAGWLGKSCVEKFNCSDCSKLLIQDHVDLNDKKQLLLINKTYSNIISPTLKSPSEFLFQLVTKLLDYYTKHIDELYKINLVTNLMQNLKSVISVPANYHNLIHLDYIINKLLEVKIHDYCKNRKKSLQSKSKLRILQNQ